MEKLIVLQTLLDMKIPLWGILTYTGILIGYFIKQHVDFKTFKIKMEEEVITLKEKSLIHEKSVAKEIDELNQDFNSKFGKFDTRIDNIDRNISDLKESVVRLTTVVEMRLLGDMKSGRNSNKNM